MAANALPWLIRFVLRRRVVPPWGPLTLYLLATALSLVLARYLNTIGQAHKNAQGVLKAGQDLSASGITEWCWDVYVCLPYRYR